ncbi:MAG: DUF3990 domain-containing protein [Candidatus Symbiothrix sp.]|jgi:hypothetical protein|nr:DUF3990 domain-containing protein [Candidatus Symbiothrix sp.]
MKVFHGSDTPIEAIDLSKCKTGRDFGQGFYVTKFRRQAEDIAVRVSEWNKTNPVITEFEFNEFAYNDNELNILRFDNYTDEWLDFILLNRSNMELQPAHLFDIIEGPVADDDVTARIYDYLNGDVSKEEFLTELKFKKPMHQLCFCTFQSLQMLKLNYAADGKIMHIDDYILEALVIEYNLEDAKAADLYYASKTYSQLIDETTGLFQKPWTEVYKFLLQELKL